MAETKQEPKGVSTSIPEPTKEHLALDLEQYWQDLGLDVMDPLPKTGSLVGKAAAVVTRAKAAESALALAAGENERLRAELENIIPRFRAALIDGGTDQEFADEAVARHRATLAGQGQES